MRWKRTSMFIIVMILSLAYTYVSFLNFIGPLHRPILTIQGTEGHPLFVVGYWLISLLISWGIYFKFRTKPSMWHTLILLLVGVALIFSGIFLWDVAIRYENLIISASQ